jgi:hypothetical protein
VVKCVYVVNKHKENEMLKHSIPKKMIDAIDYMQEGDGDAGWMIYLKDGYSFDPMSNDGCRWIPEDCAEEALDLHCFIV